MKLVSLLIALALLVGWFAPMAETAHDHPVLTAHGVIERFHADPSGFLLRTPHGRVRVVVNDQTRVGIGDQPAQLSDLEVGMRVVVTGPAAPRRHLMLARVIRARAPAGS